MQTTWLYFENGLFLEAESFGATGTKVGEIVFNTSLSGYQEIVSDPSYAGQFITFTMPEIGNVGINQEDMESNKLYSKGIIVRNYNEEYSNYRAQKSLSALLNEHDVMGICNIDTRYITKTLREEGSMMMIASTHISDINELKTQLSNSKRIEDINYIKEVSTKESYIHQYGAWNPMSQRYEDAKKSDKKIVVIDFGVKRNILNELVNSGLEVEVVPSNTTASSIINRYNNSEIGGLFLSNGPGDPLVLEEEVSQIKELIKTDIPIFAICLGHQLLSIAHGHDTYKLQFGQHGGNHPVGNKSIVEITAQNHNYNVPISINEIAEITHKNLFDDTIEGVKYLNKNIFSVQHHPESSPGPHDSKYIFDDFAQMVEVIK